MRRDYQDPLYKQWRLKVFRRDRWKCKWPGCLYKGRKLNAHHIKKWATYPELRYTVSNGITVCITHHNMTIGKEEIYEQMFLSVLAPNDRIIEAMKKIYGAKDKNPD